MAIFSKILTKISSNPLSANIVHAQRRL